MEADAVLFFAVETLQAAGLLVDFGLAFAAGFFFLFEEFLRATFFVLALLLLLFCGFRVGRGFGGRGLRLWLWL